MSEDKKSLINLVPDSVDNAVKNITDKPTKRIGTIIDDLLFLVFGGISQAAEKRKLKYFYARQEFEHEIKENIAKIPKDKLSDIDIQIIIQALDAAKYCVEKEDVRAMYAKLISSSLNIDTNNYVHPSFVDIIKNLSPMDAKLLQKICNEHNKCTTYHYYDDSPSISISFRVIENNGLILKLKDVSDDTKTAYGLTYLGVLFCKTCINNEFDTSCFYES